MPATPNDRLDRIRREGLKLIALVAITVAAFFATRAAAESSRAAERRDAAEWNARGRRALADRNLAGAIDAFRRASLRDRGNSAYGLSLAEALSADQQDAAAERVLLALRESAPERPDINLQLARIAARRSDPATAIRYYRNALYAPWQDPEGPRRVRLELVHFLLDRGDRERAVAELLAARATAPDTAASHTQLGELFNRAGDARLAREEFERALRLDASDAEALTGAGRAAFLLGDYRAAARYLHQAPALVADAADMLDVADRVLARDPLQPRLGAAERRRRLQVDMDDARGRLEACAPDAEMIEWPQLPARVDQDDIDDTLAAIAQAEAVIAARCQPSTAEDRALQIVGRRRGADR